MTNVSSFASTLASARAPRVSLAQRVDRQFRRFYARTERRMKRLTAKAVYSLPILSRRDPRRRVMSLREYCEEVDAFPTDVAALAEPNWYVSLRPPERVAIAESVSIHPQHTAAFAGGVQKFQGGARPELPEVFLASVAKAKVATKDFLLLSPENHPFFESALSRRDYLEASGILDTLLHPRPTPLPGEYCLLANRSIRGYYHWLIEILPKLSVIEAFSELADIPLILPARLSAFHTDALAAAGIAAERIRRLPPGLWQADRIFFPEMLGPTGVPSPHAVTWLRRTFLGAGPRPRTGPGRRLYLTRRDATQRRVLNESELVGFLLGLGFEVVCPGELSFAQQIELFRSAEIVFAPHGAALTNMVFAPAGGTFVEFFGDNYINGCYGVLAHHCRHRHGYLVGPSQWLDYEIPLRDLEAMVVRLGV